MGVIPLSNPIPGVGLPGVLRNAGAPTAGVSAVKQLATGTGTITAGTFPLSGINPLTKAPFTTAAIAYNASAATIAAALNAVLAAGVVTGGGGALPGAPVTLTLGGAYANRPFPTLTVGNSGLTGGTLAVTDNTVGVFATGTNTVPVGGQYIDTTAGKAYINTGTQALPVWTVVGAQS